MAPTSTARKQKRKTKAKPPKVVRRKAIAARSAARNSTAQRRKRIKAKAPKVVRGRAMAARIGVADTKQRAADARPSGGMEKTTITEAGRMGLPRDTAPPNGRPPAGVMDQPSGAPIAERQSNSGNQQTKHQPSRSIQSYVQAMGTAMHALQLLLALPLLSLQMWQNAMLGVRRLER